MVMVVALMFFTAKPPPGGNVLAVGRVKVGALVLFIKMICPIFTIVGAHVTVAPLRESVGCTGAAVGIPPGITPRATAVRLLFRVVESHATVTVVMIGVPPCVDAVMVPYMLPPVTDTCTLVPGA
jgi:hypothetical protein